MTRIALLPWAALLLASPATAQVGVAPPSGFIVAATQGQVSVTGTTSVTNVAALRVPANSVGRNGHVEIKALVNFTNSANNKVLGIRWGTTAGATSGAPATFGTFNTAATAQVLAAYRNNNATNAQVSYNATTIAPFGSTANALSAGAIDTTVDSWINLDLQLALGTESITLVHAYAVVFPAS